jgi:outer membrane protein TolC
MKTDDNHSMCKVRVLKNLNILLISVIVLTMTSVHDSGAEVLTLRDCIQLAAENSRILKIIQREEAISEADTLFARAEMLPDVNATASYTSLAHQPAAIFGLQTVPVSEKNFLSYSLSIQQTLYDFRGNASRYGASKAIFNTKKLDIERVRNLVVIDVIILYFDLLESEKLLLVAQKEVDRFEAHLIDAGNLYGAGVITKNDLLQAEVKISDAKQKLLSAKNYRALNASRLNTAILKPLTAEIQVIDNDGVMPEKLEMDRAMAWEKAEKKRLEISIVDETLKSLNFEQIAKRSEYFPHFFVKGGYDYTENRYQIHEGNWSLLFGMGMNLFKGGSTKAELMKIENQKLKLHEQRNMLIEEIRLEVERYLLDTKNAWERIAVTKDAVRQAEENLRINRLKYEEGIGTATDVVDAVTLLTIAETNYYRALYDLRRAEGAFLYATGTNLREVYQ